MSSTSPINSEMSREQADAWGEQVVLTRVFQGMLKKPEDDDAETTDVGDQVNQPIAMTIASGITGFGQ